MELNPVSHFLRKWEAEAAQITRQLGLVYSESNPPPQGRTIGDVLPASNNAITHAYVSAKLSQLFGYGIARDFGDAREINQPPGPGEAWDTYKDLYNNEVGRRIGECAGGFGDVTELLKDAWRNGDLIVVRTDSRIPPNYSYSREGIEFFDTHQVSWQGPSLHFRPPPRCFPGPTPILMEDGTSRPISAIALGDWILAFDPARPFKGLVPRQVTKLFRNTTESWLKLSFLEGGTLSATPGHDMLAADGRFARLDRLVQWNHTGEGRVVLVGEDGAPRAARVEHIRFSAATADMFGQVLVLANDNRKHSHCA